MIKRENLHKIRSFPLAVFFWLASLLAPTTVYAGFDLLNMPVGVTPISRAAYDIHMIGLWICVAIGVLVFGVMFYSMIMHRRSVRKEPAKFHHSTTAEIVWTVIPCIILVVMGYYSTLSLIEMEDTSESEITIKATGYQWKWRYDYLGENVGFYSNLLPESRAAIYDDPSSREYYLLEVDNPVVIPVNTKIRVLVTADDVIHSWWIPDFGMKKDGIPGFISELWINAEKEGIYRGQCAELCGKDHGFMPIEVHVKSKEAYAEWIAQNQEVASTVVKDGAVASIATSTTNN